MEGKSEGMSEPPSGKEAEGIPVSNNVGPDVASSTVSSNVELWDGTSDGKSEIVVIIGEMVCTETGASVWTTTGLFVGTETGLGTSGLGVEEVGSISRTLSVGEGEGTSSGILMSV